MNNRALVSAIAVAFVVAGCETTRTTGGGGGGVKLHSKECNVGTNCDIHIKVTSCADNGSGITLDHNVVGIKHNSGEVDIQWVIDTPNFKFDPRDGVKFKTAGWEREFHSPQAQANQFNWKDKNSPGTPNRPYDYSVRILKRDGSLCAVKDPTIINDV
jgi:hypothetical protein